METKAEIWVMSSEQDMHFHIVKLSGNVSICSFPWVVGITKENFLRTMSETKIISAGSAAEFIGSRLSFSKS